MSAPSACYRPPPQAEPSTTDRVLDGLSDVDAAFSGVGIARTAAEGAGARLAPHGPARAMGLSGAGVLFGGMNIAGGVRNIRRGETEQGTAEILSGGAGMAVSAMEMMGRRNPQAAVISGLMNLGTYGNPQARDAGWYGRDPGAAGGPPVMEGNASRPLGFAESLDARARSGYQAGSTWAGGGRLGSIVGSGAAVLTGADQLVRNSVNAVGAGAMRMIGAPPQAPTCPPSASRPTTVAPTALPPQSATPAPEPAPEPDPSGYIYG